MNLANSVGQVCGVVKIAWGGSMTEDVAFAQPKR
jgi:hypothetical protein